MRGKERRSAVGEEAMVETTLTDDMIATGAALVRWLDQAGLQPDAAFWLYFPDPQTWKLVLAEAKLDQQGPRAIYGQIQDIMSASGEERSSISLDSVTLVKPDAPIVSLLRSAIRTGTGIGGIRFTNNVINGTLIEDAYIYRLA
jgi:hypothetical protein